MARLSNLAYTGHYAAAEQLASGLLAAYPNDQRLVAIKDWLDKLAAGAKPSEISPPAVSPTAPPAPAATATAAVQSPPNPGSAEYSGLDKVDYDALFALARQARQTDDDAQQKILLIRFMHESDAFLAKHPNQTDLWVLRATFALGLNDIAAGYDAGQKLLAAGAVDSNDQNLLQLMTQLKNKGWLDRQNVEKALQALNYNAGQNHTVSLPNDLTLNLVWIAPGTFAMGSARDERDSEKDERPQTVVTITKGFWLGQTLVTQGQYQALMGNSPSDFTAAGPEAPVEQVSWGDATEFCRKLTEQERATGRLPPGYVYTLPTEAQWEYACRAGTTGPFYADDLSSIAWYDGNSGSTTHPVGQKEPNAWGLYDMLGNVWEWCSDLWADRLPGGEVTDPTGPDTGTLRVNRGGGWGNSAAHCRCAVRHGYPPSDSNSSIGFRVAVCPER
jgi:formylglycine-generating enzyme required for sulfatase activity